MVNDHGVCVPLDVTRHAAMTPSAARPIGPARWYVRDRLLQRLAPAPSSASRRRMAWGASDISPGLGRCPPPISPTSEMV